MAASVARPVTRTAPADRTPAKPKQNRTDIWTSLLRQTRVAQSRNRSNAVAHRQVVVCGGSSEDQRAFLTSLKRPPPPQTIRRNRGDDNEADDKGALHLSNRYAYGYGHVSLFSAPQGGSGVSALGRESEEVAHLDCHCIPEPDVVYEVILRKLLADTSGSQDDNIDDSMFDQDQYQDEQQLSNTSDSPKRPTIAILLSWKEPWKFLTSIRAWLQLIARALLAASVTTEEDPMEVVKEHELPVMVVVQHVEAQQAMEREGWTEETFDYVCQTLRTAILPLHPYSALAYTASISQPQQPSSPLLEIQKVMFTALRLDLASLSPRNTPSSVDDSSAGLPIKQEDLLPRHNVVDRMNIVIPGGWDSAGKVRLLSETFSPEEVLSAWTNDLSISVFPSKRVSPAEDRGTGTGQDESIRPTATETGIKRQTEEVFAADPPSPVSSMPDSPTGPAKTAPSAIAAFESQVVNPNAHKAPKPPTITVVTRQEQDFLREMKVELDNYAAKDRERNAASGLTTPTSNRIIGVPAGESTGALEGLGDVSFNVGGVSYNTVSAEAAIERLKRPQIIDTPGGAAAVSTPTSSTQAGAASSRAGTPRQPRRHDRDHESTPGVTSPGSTSKLDFPSEDLEKYFASLAKKAGGADSRQTTPSRH